MNADLGAIQRTTCANGEQRRYFMKTESFLPEQHTYSWPTTCQDPWLSADKLHWGCHRRKLEAKARSSSMRRSSQLVDGGKKSQKLALAHTK
eukprot:2840003-Amphidinium_carterae.1